MKIRYDTHGFVWESGAENVELSPASGHNIAIVSYPYPDEDMFDTVYGLPLHRYENGIMRDIDDPLEYSIDADLWSRYQIKLSDQIQDWIKTKTNDQLKAIHDESPTYIQNAIYEELEAYWSHKLPDYRLNLSFEVMLRAFAEVLYIRDVEQRELTEGENTAYVALLQTMKDHSSVMKPDPNTPLLDPNAWYHSYLHLILQTSDSLRGACIPQRYYITGRF